MLSISMGSLQLSFEQALAATAFSRLVQRLSQSIFVCPRQQAQTSVVKQRLLQLSNTALGA